MSKPLNVIALISGGKDSLFSLLHCIENGHKIVALANLYPTEQTLSPAFPHNTEQNGSESIYNEGEDLNSFMYQTVGHSIIPLYSNVLRLPLYRRQITGSLIQQSQYYDTSRLDGDISNQVTWDETEDLVPLLKEILASHPEANAVSSGAILSTYQRTRIESIATRLGLISLSYLWQYPVLPRPIKTSNSAIERTKDNSDTLTGLLEDISSSGMDARIIKIASAGISEGLLFCSIADQRTQSKLVNGLAPFFEENDEIGLRGAVLGEGGEYETIALNGPPAIWTGGKIEIDESTTDSYTEGGVSYFRFGKARAVPHSTNLMKTDSAEGNNCGLAPVPPLLDPQFARVKDQFDPFNLPIPELQDWELSDSFLNEQDSGRVSSHNFLQPSISVASKTITVSNITSLSTNPSPASEANSATATEGSTAATQMDAIANCLPDMLREISKSHNLPPLSVSDISSTTLLLNSMSNFIVINAIYSQIYPKGLPNPPSRATIACPLPADIEVSLSLVLNTGGGNGRQGLHVQGRSYWAPANIGPYSQAITVPITRISTNDREAFASANDSSDEVSTENPIAIVYIAGQIPLVPASMDVFSGSFFDTVLLGLQHLWRIGQERLVDIWPWAVAYLAQDSKSSIRHQAETAAIVWKQAHLTPTWASTPDHHADTDLDSDNSDTEDVSSTVDIWDIQRNRSQYTGFRQSNITIGQHLHILPNHSIFNPNTNPSPRHIPPFIAAEITALPRNVSIEWWSNGITNLTKHPRSPATWSTKTFPWGNISQLSITPHPAQTTTFISYLIKARITDSDLPTTLPSLLNHLSTTLTITSGRIVQSTTFLSQHTAHSTLWASFTSNNTDPLNLATSTTIIPCYTLYGSSASVVQPGKAIAAPPGDSGCGVDELGLAFVMRVDVSS